RPPTSTLFPYTTLFRSVQFITVQRDKLEPLTSDDVYRRLLKADNRPDKPAVKLPAPFPRRSKSTVSKDTREAITEAQDAQLLLRSEEHTSELQSRENLV